MAKMQHLRVCTNLTADDVCCVVVATCVSTDDRHTDVPIAELVAFVNMADARLDARTVMGLAFANTENVARPVSSAIHASIVSMKRSKRQTFRAIVVL